MNVIHASHLTLSLRYLAGTVKVQAAAAKRDPKQRIVVTGMGCASVFGNDVDHFYNQ